MFTEIGGGVRERWDQTFPITRVSKMRVPKLWTNFGVC